MFIMQAKKTSGLRTAANDYITFVVQASAKVNFFMQLCKEMAPGGSMQKVDFLWEFIIADDYSTDGTRAIVLEYKEKYPNLIKLIPRERNVGASINWKELITAARSKYIAYFEGDDYWTDPNKLQIQVDFLEENPDYVICFHRAKLLYQEGILPVYPDININTPDTTTLDDISKGNYIHTPTVVFKNVIKNKFPEWLINAYPGDWALHIINACYGKIKFLPEEMAVYRIHSLGMFSTKDFSWHQYLPTYKYIANHLKKTHPEIYKRLMTKYYRVYFNSAGLRNEQNKNRLQRIKIFINAGWFLKAKKLLLFFWLPIFFGNKTETVWNKLDFFNSKSIAK